MSDPFNVPPVPEQDQSGGDGLPTYDDLAQQNGPNSRFGRWREWIEKRAAERYHDLTPADLERRRQRGWGDGLDRQSSFEQRQSQQAPSLPTFSVYAPSTYSSLDGSSSNPYSMYSNAPSAHPMSMYSNAPSSYTFAHPPSLQPQLHLQTSLPPPMPSPFAHANYPPPPQTLIPESLDPSHLKLYNFGSRFLPHTTSPIRCLLPLNNHRLLLIGHDDGLSVLDMFPGEWDEDDDTEKGPADAEAKLIWEGEGVHQMSILESESTGEGTPQGVVLALVSTEETSAKEREESMRTLRMYNLSSLISLAKYYSTQKGARPLDLRSSGKNSQSHGKKHHRPPSSITKGLKNLVLDNGIAQPQSPPRQPEPRASYSSITDSWTSPGKSKAVAPPSRADSGDSDWDMVNELPLRWATNYTPLASSGSRLQNSSVLLYEVWRNEGQRGPGGVLLAIATKSSILLYEAPKGERAFRFSKEFYTPLPARSITFIHQSVQDSMSRSPSDVFPRTAPLDSASHRHNRVLSFGSNVRVYPTQLSLFVVFEKKAGTIRIADAAVGEVELYEDNWSAQQAALMNAPSVSSLTSRRSRASWDGRGFSKEKGVWIRPVKFDVPGPGGRTTFTQMYLLTRGRQSQLVTHPLPAKVSAVPPYRILYWTSTPTHVAVRICNSDDPEESPYLQAIAFGEDGVEVLEVPLSQLSERKGKGRAQDPVRTQADVGGAAGMLMVGGHWDRPFYQGGLQRSLSTSSADTYASSTLEDEEGARRLQIREGVYGWVQKGAEDYRVLWLGDASVEDDGFDDFE
ncbi:hypothetical protein BD309DRAFT_952396 [Dichomitus squalens]|uniref:Uncharacterized protein n=1 Tax=Dichomitus squalens TaxID=114155 RepID=A0A4V2K576_9APHY|nr:hypothetical protein BD309DRAFT_952396 [Dichomitus squalens]TBU63196.1 hypothetical protein BD310DRAFT_916954 [Dichomitus squalens]